jgi:hypothetical protein
MAVEMEIEWNLSLEDWMQRELMGTASIKRLDQKKKWQHGGNNLLNITVCLGQRRMFVVFHDGVHQVCDCLINKYGGNMGHQHSSIFMLHI